MTAPAPSLTFPILERFDWLIHGFTLRQETPIAHLARAKRREKLEEGQISLLQSVGISSRQLHLAEQVHGAEVVIAIHDSEESPSNPPVPVADGLVTALPGLALGIHVADCCAVYLVETRRRAIALLHSGRRGTEAVIARNGVRRLARVCGGNPADMAAVLSPCIHACCYDTDFVGQIERQLAGEGVGEIWRHPDCTGCHPERYYSYRKEKGDTGRMLAFMMIR